jgi:hypothetical protein
MEYILATIIALPLLYLFSLVMIKFLSVPVFFYEKIKKIFKVKDDSTADGILAFIFVAITTIVLAILFPM